MNKKLCPICKKITEDKNFCQHCRYPLNVKKLKEYNKDDIKNFLTHLKDALKLFNQVEFEDKFLEQVYHESFNFNWLRPETAVFNFMQTKALNKLKKYFTYPTLDLGCGNGVFTSIFFGARLDFIKDDYSSVNLDKTDIYNSYKGSYKDIIIHKPKPIGCGMDVKENSIKNARDLNVYDDLCVGDVRKIPFKEKFFNTVFSNIIDDIKEEDLPKVLKEANRVLKNNKYFIFITPTENYRESLFYYPLAKKMSIEKKHKDAELFLQYDRGRSEWEPRSRAYWEKLLSEHSFKVVSYTPFLDSSLLNFWDVGFRPFFPELIKFEKLLKEKECLFECKDVILEITKNYFFNIINRPLNKDITFSVVVAKKIADFN